jgi:thiamine pyrophosphate-dependent acetolactate synthase large subunit-like protein
MGGSIGYGTPVATGAAVACPDRRVIALEGDGSAMYTIQSLWTQAREQLDITTVIFANRTYEILKGEYLYIDTRETYTQSAIAGGAGGAAGVLWTNRHTDPGTHTGKFGINYRF